MLKSLELQRVRLDCETEPKLAFRFWVGAEWKLRHSGWVMDACSLLTGRMGAADCGVKVQQLPLSSRDN